ncbi:MAG TPA: di-trans,poly-cis-decaprenylcistransferase [Gemmatimonadaceae bacterium]|nr:di-trans,poly-cis-decaprenylcistransferase [Gemmatimonadaceae bacterium]
MRPSTLITSIPPGLHVGIIMDGNGRWAVARGLPRSAGHRRGAETVRAIVEAAPDHGIRTLTLYAFSSDNWRRPEREVSALMRLFRAYLRGETRRLVRNGVKLTVIGRRDRLELPVLSSIDAAETATAAGTTLHLRLAIDYSSRDALARAAAAASRAGSALTEDALGVALGAAYGAGAAAPDVDLLIRTGGERRLSDFLLWECAYAELWFSDIMWPAFTAADLAAAVTGFHARERRFGGLVAQPVQAPAARAV